MKTAHTRTELPIDDFSLAAKVLHSVDMRTHLVLGSCFALLAPGSARASNGGRPRTPVDWSQVDVACRSVVDRSQDPIWHLEYGIPFEDTDVTPDEVADSRRHQFFAVCRPVAPEMSLPNWITQADVASAATKDLVDPAKVEANEVLETSAEWDGCWTRLNADDDRRPITSEAAEQGVDWDTSTVPVGTYSILGYTYEPAVNLWVRRQGFVKVTDGEDSAKIGPSAAISSSELILRVGETGMVEGCTDALTGSTMTLFYASTRTEGGAQWVPEWVPFASDVEVTADTFAVPFSAPEELSGQSAAIRLDITDPQARTYTTYMLELVVVLPASGGDDGCDGNTFIQSPDCATTTGTATTSMTDAIASVGGTEATSGATATNASEAGQDTSGTASGCGCSLPRRGSASMAWLLVCLGLARSRRR